MGEGGCGAVAAGAAGVGESGSGTSPTGGATGVIAEAPCHSGVGACEIAWFAISEVSKLEATLFLLLSEISLRK